MIEDIKNINIPDYAEFKDASAQLQDMGEKTITANVEIAGGVVPDFSSDWEVEFQGERYIMPLRSPQGSRDNTKLSSSLSLTFQHWAIYQLKRYYFVTLQPIESGTAIADKYEASVNLNLHDFCNLFGQVLKHYYGNAIKVDLNPSWAYDSEPATVEISHSYIWDVLAEVYNLYGVRWQITGSGHAYTIKFGYPTNEVAHIFEQGFSGGLLKVERQVQNDNIRNKIIGRGGNENLPYRYFKQKDENNDTFSPDPDWIPELANIYFDKLRGATFRSYVQGWKQKHYGGASVTSADNAYAPWAWQKGYTDAKFDPVEYVKDDESIARYGELYGGYDNDDIKPTIQGITIDPIGRVDEVVDVEKVLTDDYEKTQEAGTVLTNIGSMKGTMQLVRHQKDTIPSNIIEFSVQEGKTANIERGPYTYEAHGTDSNWKTIDLTDFIVVYGVEVSVKKKDGTAVSSVGIPPGDYRLQLIFSVENTYDVYSAQTTVCCDNVNIVDGNVNPKFQSTWDIWVKNIWQTSQNEGETDAQYAERVWRPILGDKEKNEAKVVFSDGMLAFSSDYEFVITSIPKKDDSKTRNGVQSEWRITLGKSDADLETLGVYQPSVERFAEAGDHFFFTGIDMPHLYVVWAEERLDDFKGDQLNEVKDIKPSWLVSPDKVRIGEAGAAAYGETETLLSQLHIGDTFRLADQVFIKDAAYETLYLQSITYNYKGTLNPDVEIVLSNDYAVSANPVEELQGEVSALNRQVGSLSNIEQVVRAVGDKLYLRKDGIYDRSVSPTEFLSRIMGGNFRAGIVGGMGWGFYQDENGDWVLETDQVKVRHDMTVNNLVINQISAQGGMVIESAASMTVTGVVEEMVKNDKGLSMPCYTCYFDTKNGSVPNLFKIDDIVLCQGFDKNADDKTKYYKRRVFYIGDDHISLFKSIYKKGDDIPEVGDVLVQYGSYTDANRRFVKIRDVVGGGYERYISDLSKSTTEGTEYYFVGRMTGQYGGKARFLIGDKSKDYIEWENSALTIKGKLTVDSTIGDKSVEEYVGDIVDAVAEDLQAQIDGQIETWFYAGVPTMLNQPANDWVTTAERNNHIGDLYYDKNTGRGYRFMLDNGIYKWVELQDTDITKALADASRAQATADGKMTVFTEQPKPPYAVGDIWVNATYTSGNTKYTNDILRCKTSRSTGNFVASDWRKASDYDCTEVVIENGIITGGTVQLAGGGNTAASATVKAGITGNGNSDDDVRIWSGSTFDGRGSAPFRVTQGGKLFATEANIEGNINAPNAGLSNDEKDEYSTFNPNTGIGSNYYDFNAIRFWAGESYKNRTKAPFRVKQDGSVFMNNATLEGVLSFKKESGYITANVQRPFVTITSSNFSDYFTVYGSNYSFNHDFSFGLIINSVPSSVNGKTLYIRYSGNVNNTDFLSKNYGNTFVVQNNTNIPIGFLNTNVDSNTPNNGSVYILKCSIGYIRYLYNHCSGREGDHAVTIDCLYPLREESVLVVTGYGAIDFVRSEFVNKIGWNIVTPFNNGIIRIPC